MDKAHRIAVPVADVLHEPGGRLERQLLFGEAWHVSQARDGFVKGHRPRDGYAGWIAQGDLKQWADPSHRIGPMGAHVYAVPDIKTRPLMLLPYQAEITLVAEEADFVELAGGGYVFHRHVTPLAVMETDPARVCERYLGAPYLWGGNSQFGIDCSGLVSAGLRACGLAHPGDSGDQARALGRDLDASDPLIRNDLIFWKGHIGIMLDAQVLLHANGHHMRTVSEPLAVAAERILSKGDGPITRRKRLG